MKTSFDHLDEDLRGNVLSALREQKKREQKDSTFVFGKVPAQAIPMEESVLGALLIDKDAFENVQDILFPESFYLDSHQLIYRAIKDLAQKGNPIDVLTVISELKTLGHLETIGGAYYLVELTNKVSSSANVEYHANIIQQHYLRRKLVHVSADISRQAYDDTNNVFELLKSASNSIAALEAPMVGGDGFSASDLALLELTRFDKVLKQESDILGTSSGFPALDDKTLGFEPENLYIFAARPGMGKTALVLQFMLNMCSGTDEFVGLFSLEMGATQLVQRLGAISSHTRLHEIRNPKLMNPEQRLMYQASVKELSNCTFRIDDTPGALISQIDRKVRFWLKKYPNMKGLIIDYLQMMGSENSRGTREEEVGAISRGLKAIAKQHGIWVIALSSLNRSVETRGGSKRPMLSDLRESGSIESDADFVGFLYRPEYYQIMEDENGVSTKGLCEVIIAKNRHGALDTVKLKFDGDYVSFSNWEESNSFPVGNLAAAVPLVVVKKVWEDKDDDLPF